MAIFYGYFSLPEGNTTIDDMQNMGTYASLNMTFVNIES